jgi:hypothetical protein
LTPEQLEKLACQDRLTGEDIRGDWEFELAVVVVMGPKPAAAPKPEATK